MKNSYIILLIILISSSCRTDLDYEIRGYSQKIMVEGYIANDEFPKVYVSLNVPLWKQVDSVSILENVVRTAKVTISDGEKTEVLTAGFWDNTHFPPHFYKGFDLKGVAGNTYFLTVEYGGHIINAQTTIPYAIENLSFKTTPTERKDSLRILSMSFDIDPARKNAYRVFTKKTKDKSFVETPILYNAEFTLSGNNSFNINPQPSRNDLSYTEGIYFAKGDIVQVKLCAIDSALNI